MSTAETPAEALARIQAGFSKYDIAILLAVSADEPTDADEDELTEARELLARLREWKPAKKSAKTWIGCNVEWLEWGGSRKRPTATERTAEGCTVEHTGGAFVVVTLPDGGTMKKKIGSRGFRVSRDGRTVISETGVIFDAR